MKVEVTSHRVDPDLAYRTRRVNPRFLTNRVLSHQTELLQDPQLVSRTPAI